jgi:DNA/RNA-binding domain of Phe-tRNA-synthetase-like protein
VSDETPSAGRIAPAVAAEFPELALWRLDVDALSGRSPDDVRERLRHLANRFRGAEAVLMRTRPIPHAYRVFFRHIGLDPDAQRTPVEQRALERLMHGGFRSAGIVEDALTIAIVETGVPVWALDDDRIEGPLGLRTAQAGERLGEGEFAPDLAPGRLVVADAAAPVAVLFGDVAPSRRPGRDTRLVRLFTVAVPGVPDLHVEEALFGCADALSEDRKAE